MDWNYNYLGNGAGGIRNVDGGLNLTEQNASSEAQLWIRVLEGQRGVALS